MSVYWRVLGLSGPFRCTPAKSAIGVVAVCNRRLWPHRLFDTSDVVSATIYVLICLGFFSGFNNVISSAGAAVAAAADGCFCSFASFIHLA